MKNEKPELLTAGKIAAQLGVSGAVVSKTIKALDIKPDLIKAGCSYYGADTITKLKASLK
ncbi:MAG: HTH domain-containing protein [Bacteroidales bacterium]|nr:HTH domain-containing protein [Bacteroidales bacterium]